MLCFPCCIDNQPPSRRRPRIDRSQIGLPTNFVHTSHMGMGELSTGADIKSIQCSMGSKGDYEHASVRLTGTLDSCIDLEQRKPDMLSAVPLSSNGIVENDADVNEGNI